MTSAAGTQQVAIGQRLESAADRPRVTDGESVRALFAHPWSISLFSVVVIVMIASVVAGLLTVGGPAAYIGEWTPATYLSAAQLLACSIVLAVIFCRRRPSGTQLTGRRWLAPRALWAVMAGGFLFLAADELFEFHERLDHFVHLAFALSETPLSDRIDDAIVLSYGLIGLFALHRGRREVWLFRGAWPALRMAMMLLFAMIALDLLTNRWFAPRGVNPDSVTIKALAGWGTVAEESLKLLCGAMLLIAFASIAASARAAANAASAAARGRGALECAPAPFTAIHQGRPESQAP